jgi:glutamine synthetase
MTGKDVLKVVKEKGVKFIRLWFTDILGQLKSVAITERELPRALEGGMGFDGSSVEGFARIFESDLVALPDTSTFQILPVELSREHSETQGGKTRSVGEQGAVGRMFCDILNPDGSPYEGDPRYVLKKNLEKAKKMGYTYQVGPEIEYFYFKSEKGTEVLDAGGYFDLLPLDMAHDLRRETVLYLEKMGIPVEYSHHEVAPSQHEIDLRFADALTMADNVQTYKVIVKEVALRRGVYATFMPKPLFGQNGSGMHTHQSLFKGSKNALFDNRDKYNLSREGKAFIAGLLVHSQEITSICNQWVNSYKRLVPGYEAPVYICWGQRNRSALVRVPMYKPGEEISTRAEMRSPDPACNPYLGFAVMLAAGLEGIEKGYKLPEPIEKDIFILSDEEKETQGIKVLPGSLIEAIQITEKSQLVKKTLGEHIFNKFIDNKKIEWDRYRTQVTDYELQKYLPIL